MHIQKAPTHAPLNPWEWPGKPFYRVQIDLPGPVMGEEIFVDAHS
jgi:hypothetical protein